MSGGGTPKIILLVIDPQVDFHPGGSLAIAGANLDSQRISDLVKENLETITDIFVTLDSHHRTHIAHGVFWKDKDGNSPAPFTIITKEDVESGVWAPRDSTLLDHCIFYTTELESKGRFKLCIWPEHCLIGSAGYAVVPPVNDAIQQWAGVNLNTVQYIMKGTNCLVEMYSAICAEVELESDPSTSIDENLIDRLNEADKLIVCGQALSHCVNFTVRDILKQWRSNPAKICVLTDCTSPVAGFEDQANQFLKDMKDAGVTVTTSAEVMSIPQVEEK